MRLRDNFVRRIIMGRVLLPLFIVGAFVVFGCSEASRKTWWAKKINEDFSTAGRLTDRQVKYAAESGRFKSILSIFFFSKEERRCNDTCNFYPSTPGCIEIAELAGIQYAFLRRGVSWSSARAVAEFEADVQRLPKPILVHCVDAFYATGIALLYLAKRSEIQCSDVFSRGRAFGFEYQGIPEFTHTAFTLTKSPSCSPYLRKPRLPLKRYWMAKRLTDCVYIAGQIQVGDICSIREDGFKTIANMRKGPVIPCGSRPSQEEVTLINIDSYKPKTYESGGRQLRKNLLKFRLDATKPNSYVSPTSTDNFESQNACEFGDEIGYNETIERIALAKYEFEYYHVPVGGCYQYDENALEGHYCVLKEMFEEKCPVLFHCRTGTRSAYFALLYLAITQKKSCQWALDTGLGIGYDYRSYPMCQVISSFASGNRQLPDCSPAPTTVDSTSSSTTITPTTETPLTTITPTTEAPLCLYRNWSAWSECSRSCGIGTQKRSREPLESAGAACKNRLPLVVCRICQHRPCEFEAAVKRGRCKSVPVEDVTYDGEEIRRELLAGGCAAQTSSGGNRSVVLPSQVWCMKSSNYEGECVPVKFKSKRFRVGRSRKVAVLINKRCK